MPAIPPVTAPAGSFAAEALARAFTHIDAAETALTAETAGSLRDVWNAANEHAWDAVVQLRGVNDPATTPAINAIKLGVAHLEENIRIFDRGADPFIEHDLLMQNADEALTQVQSARQLLKGTPDEAPDMFL